MTELINEIEQYSDIISEIEQYVINLKNMTTDELIASNLDIVFGRLLFTSSFSKVIANTIELHSIKIRIILDSAVSDKSNPIAMRYGSLNFSVLNDHDMDKLIKSLNDIFSIMENVYESDISTLTSGLFDYIGSVDQTSTNSL